jgi:hypothetical protein
MATILALIIGFLALIVAISSIRYQIITMINAQLADKAKECNSYLEANAMVPKSAHKVSGIVSAIITAEELLDEQLNFKKYTILILLNKQSILKQFYLQLHTSIRVYLKKKTLSDAEINDPVLRDQIRAQFMRAKEILNT